MSNNMEESPPAPPKPVSELWRPELVSLPGLTPARRIFRGFLLIVVRVLMRLLVRLRAGGLENLPRGGPALLVINHLGHLDAGVVLSVLPSAPDIMGKLELRDWPLAGLIFRGYGAIWVHRGRPDRRALTAAIQALREGRTLLLAPEGRVSVTGGLEEGEPGAAFIALRAGAPIVPFGLTGSGLSELTAHWRRLRRAPVTITVGRAFRLAATTDHHRAIREGTTQIMHALAALLPPEYRGMYG